MGQAWQIRREHQFTTQLEKLLETAERAEEFIRGVEWILARNPWAGKNVPGASDIRAIPVHEPEWLPSRLVLFYTLDEENEMIVFLAISAFGKEEL